MTGARKVDPYHLLFRDGQFYLLGYSHERDAIRVFRLSRIRGKVAYATKAERDFRRPTDFDPRVYGSRADWQFGEEIDVAEVVISERIAWQVERHFGRFGEIRARATTARSCSHLLRQLPPAHLVGPGARRARPRRGAGRTGAETEERIELLRSRHEGELEIALAERASRRQAGRDARGRARSERQGGGDPAGALRAARHARLDPNRRRPGWRRLRVEDVCERVQISDAELREDVNVLNVVNFGGGSYVLYAEIDENDKIEVDPEPYSTTSTAPRGCCPSRPRR